VLAVFEPLLVQPERTRPTMAIAATVVVTDNNFLVFIDTPCDVVA
jgi:hypothetical protein